MEWEWEIFLYYAKSAGCCGVQSTLTAWACPMVTYFVKSYPMLTSAFCIELFLESKNTEYGFLYHSGIFAKVAWTVNKGQSLTSYNRCPRRLSPDILHCAVVCPHNVTLTHWRVNGEHCLVGTLNRINYSLGLLVSSIESNHNPISPPSDIGSRPTSGGAGEGGRVNIKS